MLEGVDLEMKGEEEKKKRRKDSMFLMRLSDKNRRNKNGQSFDERFGKRKSSILGGSSQTLTRVVTFRKHEFEVISRRPRPPVPPKLS